MSQLAPEGGKAPANRRLLVNLDNHHRAIGAHRIDSLALGLRLGARNEVRPHDDTRSG